MGILSSRRTSERSKSTFKKLIQAGKLEILTGGWVMPDEATTHLFGLYNQLVEGQRWVWEELGVRVEYAWSLDPFGCSSTAARLLSLSGVRGLVIQRVHYSWKRLLSEGGWLDLSWNLGGEVPLLGTRVQPGPGYSVTDSCGPATTLCPDMDFNRRLGVAQRVSFHNVHYKSEIMLGQYGRLGSLSRSNVALITLGGDFRFQNSSEWHEQYDNYKALFDYINGNRNIYKAHLAFGTLKTFFSQVGESNVSLAGDFFPYADPNPDGSLGYWTGYYSTRPHVKRLSRRVEAALRSAEVLYSLTYNTVRQAISGDRGQLSKLSNLYQNLVRARRTAALCQHHDSISGTARARVMKDFRDKLSKALSELNNVLTTCVGVLLVNVNSSESESNAPGEYTKKRLAVFNSFPYDRTEVIAAKTDDPALVVRDASGKELAHQINCLFNKNHTNGIQKNIYELIFVSNLPHLSISTYDIQTRESSSKNNDYISHDKTNNIKGLVLSNNKQNVTFGVNGLVTNIKKKIGEVGLNIILKAYISREGKSGAYLFEPITDRVTVYSNKEGNIAFSDGSLYKEVVTNLNNNYFVSTRIYYTAGKLNEIIEIKVTYDMTENNTELVIEFMSDLKDSKFFTDVNGLEMRERLRDVNEPIGGRYYPMTCVSYLESGKYLLGLMTDHSHGAASLSDGSLEIMLDRRMARDDGRGLEEGVEDNTRSTSTIYLLLSESGPSSEEYLLGLSLLLNNPSPVLSLKDELTTRRSLDLLSQPLPTQVHLLNLRTLSDGVWPSSSALMFLHNTASSRVTLPLGSAFTNLTVRTLVKTSLAGITEEEELTDLAHVILEPHQLLSLKIFF